MFKDDRILALDIGASKLVLAEFSVDRAGIPVLMNYGVGRLNVDPEKETDNSAYIVSTIREIMAEHGMKPAPLYMTMSGQAVFPRYVKLPPVARDKVEQIIRYEAEQNVPFPIDEVVWDYQLISGGEGEELNAMLVAVKIENITRLTDCVTAAGLEPEIVDVAPMALYNVVRYNYPNLEGCCMVLDIGARSSNLIFIEENRIFSRSIPVAGNAITSELMKEFEVSFAEAEQLKLAHAFVAFGGVYAGPENETADRVSKVVRNVITRLHAEVNRSINFYRSQQGGQPPSVVLLTGGSCIVPHTDTFFREKLKVDVEYLNPLANMVIAENLAADRVEGDLHVLGEVAGLALRRALTCPIEINLMPPLLISDKQFRKRQPFFILAGACFVLVLLCWWVYFHRMSKVMEDRVAKVEALVTKMASQESQMKGVHAAKQAAEAKADELCRVVDLRTRWIEITEAIHGCMLDGMWLTSLKGVRSANGKVLESLELECKGFSDKLDKVVTVEKTPVVVFRDKLRETRVFSDRSRIVLKAGEVVAGRIVASTGDQVTVKVLKDDGTEVSRTIKKADIRTTEDETVFTFQKNLQPEGLWVFGIKARLTNPITVE